jgi:hypothetical protein
MPQGNGPGLPPGVTQDRRVRVDRRRLRELDASRVLGASAHGRPGYILIRAVDSEGAPAQITLPVEAAMTLLNDLHRLSEGDRWFDLVDDSKR